MAEIEPAAPLRERKKARVRDDLVRAALTSIAERGFEHTTIDEIARAAGVSRRTFFRYFDCKEAVVFAGYGERLERFRRLLGSRPTHEPTLAAVRRAALAIAEEYMRSRRELVRQYQLVQTSPALVAYELELDRGWLAALTEAFRSDLPQLEAKVLAGATLGVFRAVLTEWFEGKGRADLVELGARAFDLLERGAGSARSAGKRQ